MNRVLDREAGAAGVQACAAIAQLQAAMDLELSALAERRPVDYAALADLSTRMLHHVAQYEAFRRAHRESES